MSITSEKSRDIGNAVPGVPTAEGGNTARLAGTVPAHRTRRNAGDGVPYNGRSYPASPKKPVCSRLRRLSR